MPTGDIATQHAQQMDGNKAKIKDITPPSLSPVNSAVSSKTFHFNIEVPERLVWKGWQQGKEYIKNIVLKNVGLKTQKLKYNVPSTRFFTTLYPKPVFLSAGASFTLPVTFRPLANVEYEDKIIFTLKDGGEFQVPLTALLPQINISLPINLDFRMCAIHDNIFILFEVFNIGDVDTPLKWEVEEPFTIEPTEAQLKYGSSFKFRATFKPVTACVYEVKAICRFGKELELAGYTVFYGVGKFPHLMISYPGEKIERTSSDMIKFADAEINFGNVAQTATAELSLELHNLSPVQTPFRIERIPGMNHMTTVFKCTQTRGVIPPLSLMKIPFVYSPHTVNVTSIDYFKVTSVGDVSHSIIKCLGSAIGPNVELSTDCINFKQIDIGCTAVRQFEIINNSDMEAVYQFELDCDESVFKFSIISGFIKAKSKQAILLQFAPQFPIIYYRRVVCLVHNQSPLYLDVLGACHSEMMKPPIVCKEHLVRYQIHVERGLSFIAPDQLNEFEQSGRLEVDQDGCLNVVFAEDKANLRSNPKLQDIHPMDEYFNDGFHSDLVNILPHVSLDVNVIDFGNLHKVNIPYERTFSIRNHTRGKVTAQWIGDSSRTFYVCPDTLDIPPLKSCSFRLIFKPTAPNKLYGCELECYVYYKCLRDYKLVQDRTLCPPWCLTITCLGHTFLPNNDPYLPRAVIDPQVVVFQAINTGEHTYQTLLMGNNGDTPILYNLASSTPTDDQARIKCGTVKEQDRVFKVKPSKGFLKSGYQIFTIQMTPSAVKTYSQDLLLRLNDHEKYDQMIHLCGSAEVADVILDGDGNLYFKPTCAGTTSSRSYNFKNTSRIPIRFQWKLTKEDEKFVKVEPSYGIVQPNETVSQIWTFTPAEEKKYVLKAKLVTWGQGLSVLSSGGKKQFFSLRIIGEGSYGDLESDEMFMDFGDILVGSSASYPINIYNSSNCSLHYRLIIDGVEMDDNIDSPSIEFDSMEGVVQARGRTSIMATIRPTRRINYQFIVSYQLVIPHSKTIHPAVLEPQHLIHLLATGVYPSMTVSDIRAQGSAIGISKKSLWSLFSLNQLNAFLDSDPSVNELLFSVSQHRAMLTKTVLDFNFSAAPLGSEPCVITIMFKNSRKVVCEWAFLYPKDLQIEMGYWTESGETDQEELQEMKVMDNKLFDVTPKKGALRCGESVSVTLTYMHTMTGTHRLPVLLKIERGREVMLNFIGVTLEHTRPYIHFPSNKHLFHPIPIGEKMSPTQVYELYNGGAVPLTFEADLTPLATIKRENFDHPIFECLTASGEILPGQTVKMNWRFSPLEAKTYKVDVPIKVHNGDTAIITFTGVGYNQRDMGDTMPLTDGYSNSGVPSIQHAELPGQLGYLSLERISFGNLPLFSQARRTVYVTNKSEDRSIFFEWHVTSQTNSQFLNVYPVRGKIGPNSFKMCRVTFRALGVPSFYDLDLVCEISDLYEYTNYKRELAAWQMERDRQESEFIITENDLHADMRSPDVVTYVSGPPSKRLLKLEALAEGRPITPETELSRYKTLPPIRKLTVDEERSLERKLQKKLSQLWQKPQPKEPFILHFGITARTHDHKSFQANFPDEFNHFYIDRTLGEESEFTEPFQQEDDAPTFIECSQSEAQVVSSVLGSCLRGLLDDAAFLQAVRKVMAEPIPYFRQIIDLQSESFAIATIKNQESPKMMEDTASVSDDADTLSLTPDAAIIKERLSVVSTNRERPSEDVSRDRVEFLLDSRTNGKDHSPSAYDLVNTAVSAPADSITDSLLESLLKELELQKTTQAIKRLPEFGNAAEQILENTILNLMYEALSSDVSIISRPRSIAMPMRRISNADTIE